MAKVAKVAKVAKLAGKDAGVSCEHRSLRESGAARGGQYGPVRQAHNHIKYVLERGSARVCRGRVGR